jgi:hypothetical protein
LPTDLPSWQIALQTAERGVLATYKDLGLSPRTYAETARSLDAPVRQLLCNAL